MSKVIPGDYRNRATLQLLTTNSFFINNKGLASHTRFYFQSTRINVSPLIAAADWIIISWTVILFWTLTDGLIQFIGHTSLAARTRCVPTNH